MDHQLFRSAVNGKKRAGQKDLLDYLNGKKLTQRKAIRAKCYDCDGMGESGKCDIDTCSLFPYSPYVRLQKREGNNA